MTRGPVPLERQRIELASVVHSAIEQAAPLLQARGHTLTTTFDAGPAYVEGDRARLIQGTGSRWTGSSPALPGFDHHLVKPVEGAALARVLATVRIR